MQHQIDTHESDSSSDMKSEFGEVEPSLAAEHLQPQSDSTSLNNNEFSLFSESNNLKPQSTFHLEAFTLCCPADALFYSGK